MRLWAIGAILLVAAAIPALAQDPSPTPWRDPSTGCVYLLTNNGITPRLRRDGTTDCPDAPEAESASSPLVDQSRPLVDDQLIRDVGRSLETVIKQEMERLRREVERLAAQSSVPSCGFASGPGLSVTVMRTVWDVTFPSGVLTS